MTDIELINGIYVFNSTVDNPVTAVSIRVLRYRIPEYKAVLTRLHDQAETGGLVRLEDSDCITAYGPKYQSKHGNLILVSPDSSTPGLGVFKKQRILGPERYQQEPSSWICATPEHYDADQSRCSSFISDPNPNPDWTISTLHIDHCLSEIVPKKCKLQYSLPLAIVVMAFNLVKAIIIFLVAFTSADTPILTSGDAIASFMQTPDETTKGKCLVRQLDLGTQYNPQVKYSKERKRWGSAASVRDGLSACYRES